MKYLVALEKIEKWMDETGIRQYCRTKCFYHGCCNQVKTDTQLFDGCSKTCPPDRPPLSCAIEICSDIKERIMTKQQQDESFTNSQKVYDYIRDHINYRNFPEDIEACLDLDIPDNLINSIVNMKLPNLPT